MKLIYLLLLFVFFIGCSVSNPKVTNSISERNNHLFASLDGDYHLGMINNTKNASYRGFIINSYQPPTYDFY